MEGVNILNTITTDVHAGGLNFLCFIGFLLILCGIILIVANIVEGDIDMSLLIGICSISVGIMAMAAGYSIGGPIVGQKYTYEVSIEDSVDFNEFMERYEILEQRGSIYTIRERETD